MNDIPTPVRLNDLRMRVIEGEDISAEEMLLIVNDIRRDRRTAARIQSNAAPAARRRSKTTEVPMTQENLQAILDTEL